MYRSLIPMISAACHHAIFFGIAGKITSCTFIAPSIAALEEIPMLRMVSYSQRPQSGHLTC
jgi:hypothetical protein